MPKTNPRAQPTLKSVMQSKEVIEKCDIAISKWMIDASVPFNATNSAYYQPMIDAICSMGPMMYVGPENIVHIVTHNAADIEKLPEVTDTISHVANITKYLYNHCHLLYLMRQFIHGKEILRPAATHFVTNFIALQSILAQKDTLTALVTSREWSSSAYSKDVKAKNFTASNLLDVFEKHAHGDPDLLDKLTSEMRIYKEVELDFGIPIVIRERSKVMLGI
ncbi:hypothetical protein Lal_00035256 [Lupinus albus]|nr:hypothetical protein Lal_00035256 [Lupinus albus]